MADFVQTMKDWRRMCNNSYCSRSVDGPLYGERLCPIAAYHKGTPCDEDPIDWTEDATKQFEEIVMQWAAEHPEPQYPTWGDWFAERGDLIKLWRYIRVCSEHGSGVIGFLYNPIPTDIAQKLGIEPKEG